MVKCSVSAAKIPVVQFAHWGYHRYDRDGQWRLVDTKSSGANFITLCFIIKHFDYRFNRCFFL